MSRASRPLVGVAELVDPGLYLDLAGAVPEVEEGGLAVPALSEQATGDPVAIAGLLARLDALVRFPDRRDLRAVRESVGERLDARLAQALELRPPVGEQVGLIARPARRSRRGAYRGRPRPFRSW